MHLIRWRDFITDVIGYHQARQTNYPTTGMSRLTFCKPIITKSIGPYLGLAVCKSPILHVSCQCKLRKDQMFLSLHTSFLFCFSRWLSVGRSSLTVRCRMSEGMLRMSVQKYLSHKPTEGWMSDQVLVSLCVLQDCLLSTRHEKR